jgi:F0F1-type ATP synthase membrane subunit b/b'
MQINLVPDPSLLAIMVIFIINYLVVRRFFLQPINQVLEERETDVRTAEEAFERSLASFNEATARMEQQLHAAKREAAAVREKRRAEAAARRQQLIEETQGQAKGQVAEAEQKLTQDVAVARERIVRDAEMLARTAAERILGRAV